MSEAYRPVTGPEVRLYTVISRRNGSGAHSALLVTTTQERILFDPAGSFKLSMVPERGDVHYDITPAVLETYIDYHARETFDLVEQTLFLTASEAEHLARLVKANGTVPRMQCTRSVTRILSKLPRFETINSTYFPNVARRSMAQLPGVEARTIRQDDAHDNHDVLLQANAAR
ncbi:MAG: hypothetical protein AAFY31_12820 [Pseudomonadota bacterium]